MSEQSRAGAAPGEGLVPQEGVDEGSAATTGEGPHPPAGDGVLGPGAHGSPDGAQDGAGPVDMETGESRAARDERGTGQQLAEGEG
jgi:hypothetical protein